PDIPDAQLARIGCGVTTGVGAALNTAKVKPGSSVAVLGCGGVGQAVIQGARIAGAGRIIAIDPQELKRRTAKQLGATDTIDPSQGDPVEQVKALTGGRGADYAFEVIGLPETILTTYNLARRGGEVIIVGMARFEAQDAERDLVGGVPGHPVRSTGEDLELRPPDRRVQARGVGERKVLVPRAPEHQRRAADARVERRQPWQRALVAAAHARDVVAHRVAPEALPEVGTQGGWEARPARQEGGLGAPEHDPGQSPEDQLVPAEATEDADLPRGLLVPEHERVRHHQPRDACRVAGGERQRRLAPHVHADDGGALDLPGVEQPEQAIGHVAGRLATG